MTNGLRTNQKIVVLLATFNGNKYLEKSLKSLVDQTYSNFEVYVCDDGSDEKPDTIIKSFEPLLSIKYFKNSKNIGIAATYLKLINKVKMNKDIGIFFAQDDIMRFNYIEQIVKCFKKKNVVYVYPILAKIDAQGFQLGSRVVPINLELIYGRFKPAAMLRANYVISPGSSIRLNMFEDEMLGDTSNLFHDWQQSLYLSLKGKFKICYGSILFYRIHNESTSFTHNYSFIEAKEMINNFQKSRSLDIYFRNLKRYEKFIYKLVHEKSIALLNSQITQSFTKKTFGESNPNSNKNVYDLPRPRMLFFNNLIIIANNRYMVLQTSLKYCLKNLIQRK